MEYTFSHPGATQKEIGAHFGLAPQRISAIFRSKRVQEAYPMLARQKRLSLIPKAVAVEEELLLRSRNDLVRHKVIERVYADHKISETQPTTQINVFQSMPNDELHRIIGVNKQGVADSIDTTLVDQDQLEQGDK